MPGRFFALMEIFCIEGREDDVGRKATTEVAREAIRAALNIFANRRRYVKVSRKLRVKWYSASEITHTSRGEVLLTEKCSASRVTHSLEDTQKRSKKEYIIPNPSPQYPTNISVA